MEKVLTLKLNGQPFPSSENPAVLHDFKYSAKRMGNAPSISATLIYPQCLDSIWSDNVYTEFRGEKYYIKQTPSSSYDNSSVMYSHTIDLVSERIVLETVYFFDVVREDTENDKPVSNSSRFTFFGTVNEFAKRFEYSAKWSGLDYTVVVDDDVVIEEKQMQFQDQFLYNALQSMYETYKIPFYFVGKEIHIGYAQNIISDTLRYGFDDALISIKRNNSGNQIINRITGLGSDRNITYYYPNPTPKGHLSLGGLSADSYEIKDALKFSSAIDLNRQFHYELAAASLVGYSDTIEGVFNQFSSTPNLKLRMSNIYTEYIIDIDFSARYSGTNQISKIPLQLRAVLNGKGIKLSPYFIEGSITDGGSEMEVNIGDNVTPNIFYTSSSLSYVSKNYHLRLKFGITTSTLSQDEGLYIYIEPFSGTGEGKSWVDAKDIDVNTQIAETFATETNIEVLRNAPGRISISNAFSQQSRPPISLSDNFSRGVILYGDEEVGIASMTNEGIISCGYLDSGPYTVRCMYTLPFNVSPYKTTVSTTIVSKGLWVYDDNGDWVDFDKAGLAPVDGYTPLNGDTLSQVMVKRVNVQNNLMPSIYRETDGEERFYNAENGRYKNDDGDDIVFQNTYSSTRPREHIYNDDEIFPTIKGITNAAGLGIDVFSEFAFDVDDNDDIYPADHERAGQYVHPYFFGKLRKFDGEHGFNLFDHALEGQPMTISMTSGKCGSCEFTIGVDEATSSFNTVQVDDSGNLIYDEDGNVLCGRYPQAAQYKQERQNDTKNYEVWVALKKDIQTFGEVMPNRSHEYIPASGDTFVILNINLPDAYVLAAEDRLEKAAIEYMAENNDYKFNYSARLSRIFFELSPDTASNLSENSKVKLEYNGVEEELYVSSYSYNMTNNSPLPEVSIDLNDEIKILKGAFDRIKGEMVYVLGPTLDNVAVQVANAKNDVSNLTFVAKSANDTAKKALSTGETLQLNVTNVGLTAKEAKTTASQAQSDATQAKEGISAVGNEVGSLKTTISATQIIASKAQSNADRALTEINNVSEESNAKFEVVDASITSINEDVNALESLIGDEYNIWFEPDTQIGSEPTLSNYPASEWTSDDDYFNHDKDLYYSITLGRAWRFMYNEGTPLWEEITDADTITALTKAQEALTKAQEALDGVSSLDFIKGVFSDDEILDEQAAVLSRLVAVKDINDEVTAGIYGGGVDGLDGAGYKDSSHGTLMMFAGANGASNASQAKFRVYEDGSIFANRGVFGGVIKKGVTNVTPASILDFVVPNAAVIGELVIDIAKIGSYIVFDGFQNTTWAEDYDSLQLPSYRGGTLSVISFGYTFDDLVGLIGVDLIFRTASDTNSSLCFSVPVIADDGSMSMLCVPIRKGDIIIATCTAGRNSSGYLNIGWKLKTI